MKTRIIAVCLSLVFVISVAYAIEDPAGILFVGGNQETSDIYLWQPGNESGTVKALCQTSAKEGNAQWWAHKQLIVASREIEPDRYGLIAINHELKTVWVCEDPIGSLGWPVPSPWDNRILCVRAGGNGLVQPGFIEYPHGTFSPFEFAGLSGGQLAWLSPEIIQLSRVTADGFSLTQRNLISGEEKIIVSGGNNWQSCVNAEAGVNLFVRRVGQVGSIFRLFQLPDQSWEYQNYTNARTYDWQPTLSADGKNLIFRSLRNGHFVTVMSSLTNSAAPEKILPIEGFSQIFFPTELDRPTVELLLNSAPDPE